MPSPSVGNRDAVKLLIGAAPDVVVLLGHPLGRLAQGKRAIRVDGGQDMHGMDRDREAVRPDAPAVAERQKEGDDRHACLYGHIIRAAFAGAWLFVVPPHRLLGIDQDALAARKQGLGAFHHDPQPLWRGGKRQDKPKDSRKCLRSVVGIYLS